MNFRQYVLPVLIACWLAYALLAGRGNSASPIEAEPGPSDSTTEVVTHTEFADANRPAQPTGLALLEVERSKRQRAGAKMEESRKELQFAASSAWIAVLTNHWQEFKALRQKAAVSPHGRTPCTLCDGTGHMDFCVVCQNSGTCPTCDGTGKAKHDEYCPTCLGKAKCYFCLGSKGMTCPFCDDGTVDVKGPMPPGMLPIN